MKIRLLTEEEENKLISPEQEEENKQALLDILPYFYYNKSTRDRVKNRILGESDEDNNWTDQFYRLGQKKRLIYEILDAGLEVTEGYRYYTNLLSYCNFTPLNIPDLYKFYGELVSVRTYETGKIEFKGVEMKLNKFLLKYNFISQEQLDKLNMLKTKSPGYFVLSRNPVDFLFCSTNQGFSTCIGLDDVKEEGYWTGLLAFVTDPNRSLVFTTNKTKIFKMCGEYVTHFRYTTRSWTLLNEDNNTFVVNPYPRESIKFTSLLKQANFPISLYEDFVKSKFAFPIMNHNGSLDNGIATIYLDNIGIKYKDGMQKYDEENGHTGFQGNVEFNISRAFYEGLESEDYFSCGTSCEQCGNRIHEDDTYRAQNSDGWDVFLCEYCLDEHTSQCYKCGNNFTFNLNETTSGDLLCSDCLSSDDYVCCTECGQYTRNGIATIDNEDVCEDCMSSYNYSECSECNNVGRDLLTVTETSEPICEGCAYVCKKCGEIKVSGLMTTNDCGCDKELNEE